VAQVADSATGQSASASRIGAGRRDLGPGEHERPHTAAMARPVPRHQAGRHRERGPDEQPVQRPGQQVTPTMAPLPVAIHRRRHECGRRRHAGPMSEPTTPVPAGLRTFIDATNRGDSTAFVAGFTEDAVLDDWGRVFHGRDGVASWNRTDNIGKRSHFELVGIEPTDDPDTVVATLTVSGDGFNGTGPMTFAFRGDLVARLTITPTR
jgi:hypothetical protein